jgi:CheY-like chemotaxis protein
MSILIVEDDKVNGTIIERALAAAGYGTVRSEDGAEALRLLRSRYDIDLVIADIIMPEMNGLEMLRDIKGSIFLCDTPVIFCSASMDVGKIRLAAALGCFTYLVKPVPRELLLEKVARALEQVKPVLVPVRQVMETRGMDQVDYLKEATALVDLLEKDVQLFDFQQKHPSLPLPDPEYRRVATLCEGLGARRLACQMEEFLKPSQDRAEMRFQLMRITWSMQRVLSLLKAQLAREFGMDRRDV